MHRIPSPSSLRHRSHRIKRPTLPAERLFGWPCLATQRQAERLSCKRITKPALTWPIIRESGDLGTYSAGSRWTFGAVHVALHAAVLSA